MKKSANTIAELLAAAGIVSFVLLIGIAVLGMMSHNLFTGQVGYTNSVSIDEVIFYITREIQSAESIFVSPDGKSIDISERDGRVFSYAFSDSYPAGIMTFDNKRVLDADFEKSSFSLDEDTVTITIAALGNNTDTGQIPKIYTVTAEKRSD